MSSIGGVTGLTSFQSPVHLVHALASAPPHVLPQILSPFRETGLRQLARTHPKEAALYQRVLPEIHALLEALLSGDRARVDSVKARLVRKLEEVTHQDPFERTPDLAASVSEILAVPPSVREPDHLYRASKLHLSPKLGGGTIPIRSGVSHVTPLPRPQGPRVLFVSMFPPSSNGSGTYTKAMAEYIIRRGGDARILFVGHQFEGPTLRTPEYLIPFTAPGKPALSGAARANFPVLDSNPASPNGRRFRNLFYRELGDYTEGLSDAVAEAVAHMHPDILVVNHAWVGAEAARRTGLPYVVVCHGTCAANLGATLTQNGYPRNTVGLVLPGVRQARRVIAITPAVGGELRDIYGLDDSRITVIPNGFHSDIFQPRPDLNRGEVLRQLGITASAPITHVVSYAGRMPSYKGITTLLEAAKQVIETMPGVHFVLAGDGQDRPNLERRAQELGISGHVHFLGQIPLDRIAQLHAIADVGVVPSWREPFGIVALEIAGVGTPVIASATGGLKDLVTLEVGRQVPPQDPEALARAIQTALSRDLKAQIGARASRHVHQNYPWEVGGARLWNELEGILERRGSHTNPARQKVR